MFSKDAGYIELFVATGAYTDDSINAKEVYTETDQLRETINRLSLPLRLIV